MTKKDYIVLAAALRDARLAVNSNPDVHFGIDIVERELVAALRADNGRFDADRFRTAAAVEKVTVLRKEKV